MNETKAQRRLADAKKVYDRLYAKHWDTIKLLVRLSGQIRKAERDVARCMKAVRQERKATKAVMAQAVEDTRSFAGDDLGHLTP